MDSITSRRAKLVLDINTAIARSELPPFVIADAMRKFLAAADQAAEDDLQREINRLKREDTLQGEMEGPEKSVLDEALQSLSSQKKERG